MATQDASRETRSERPNLVNGHTYWLDCPTHGLLSLTVAPLYRVAQCPACAAVAPCRIVEKPYGLCYKVFDPPLPEYRVRIVSVGRKAQHGRGHQCDGRCLSGKRHCDCKCEGRCHGAGVCSCVTA